MSVWIGKSFPFGRLTLATIMFDIEINAYKFLYTVFVNHFIQPSVVCKLQFQYVCMTCIASRLHEGPSHMITPLSHLPSAHVDESKIMSSAARETAHIDCRYGYYFFK